MWCATALGFFSIVRKAGRWHVRARARADLDTLRAAARLPEPVQEWPAADYRWRILVDARGLDRVFAALRTSVDYPNFKDHVAGLPGQRAKLPAYHRLWADLAQLPEAEASDAGEAAP